MKYFDVFNGDADGICSLIQLRLAEPVDSQLITGVKRDISLLQKVQGKKGDRVTVLDLSMAKNIGALNQLLDQNIDVFYVDHHLSGEIPKTPLLQAHINTSANICSALIVNQWLENAYPEWAICAAFGDNLLTSGYSLSKQIQLSSLHTEKLKNLGILLNYNGYGASVDDLRYHPADLFKQLLAFRSPLDFLQSDSPIFKRLESGFEQDMKKAQSIQPINSTNTTTAFILPNEKWARRVSGVYSNDLANSSPHRAHAVLTEKDNGNFLVSVRSPLNKKQGADELVSQFATGGGRKAAAGINDLEKEQLESFLQAFRKQFQGL